MAADLDRAYVINGDDLRIALAELDWPIVPGAAAAHVLAEIGQPLDDAELITQAQLSAVLCGFYLDVSHGGSVVNGIVCSPHRVADVIFRQWSANRAHEDDVVDAHICCDHADGPGPFSDPEVAAMAALAPALAALRRLKYDEAMRVMRWATDRATGSLPPF